MLASSTWRSKSVPAQVHAVVGQDVVAALGAAAARRAHAHEREVGRAAADVGHQHELFAVDPAFVVERGGDRFVLEVHLGKAHGMCRALQRGLRARVALGVVVDEEHRPAQHHARDRRAGLGSRPVA